MNKQLREGIECLVLSLAWMAFISWVQDYIPGPAAMGLALFGGIGLGAALVYFQRRRS